ncbi:MAG: hypothetical protein P8Y71_27195 [Pseudolabrys sp.]
MRLLTRADDVSDFAALEATLTGTQARVRESFVRILGKAHSRHRLSFPPPCKGR